MDCLNPKQVEFTNGHQFNWRQLFVLQVNAYQTKSKPFSPSFVRGWIMFVDWQEAVVNYQFLIKPMFSFSNTTQPLYSPHFLLLSVLKVRKRTNNFKIFKIIFQCCELLCYSDFCILTLSFKPCLTGRNFNLKSHLNWYTLRKGYQTK